MIRISFGIIALNAQPFLEYNLRALAPYAHQLLVVEGATLAAKSLATKDGHSLDGTLEMLMRLKRGAEMQEHLHVISAIEEGNQSGFWSEKDQMSQAYAKRATGDWLWQIDSDEFYKEADIKAVISLLEGDPEVTAVSFPYYEFFGGFDYLITGKWHLVEYPRVHRLFRWRKGHNYLSHRPATVVDENQVDLRTKKWISTPLNGTQPIFMYHYSYVFPKQAKQKVGYYSNVNWTNAFQENQRWMEDSYFGLKHPLFLGERGVPIFQWVERFRGSHPEAIEQLRKDIQHGVINEPIRQTLDIEKLLSSPVYWLVTRILHALLPPYWRLRSRLKNFRSRWLFLGNF